MENKKNENGVSNLSFLHGDTLRLEDFLQIILRRRWTVLIVTVLCLVATLLYLFKATPIYRSTSRIYVEKSGPKIMSEYEGIMTRSGNYLYTQGELMKSTPIVADVAGDMRIRAFRTFDSTDNLAGYIKGKMNVSIGRKDDIVEVSFDSPYPVEAAEIVNAIVQSYIKYHSTRKRSTVSEVLRILQKEKIKRDQELSDKFTELVEFTRENGVVSLDNQGGHIVLDRLNKLSSSLTESQLSALNARADYEAARSMENEPAKVKQFASASSTSGVHVFVNDMETQLQAELRMAEIELKNARYQCTEDHPAVQAIHSKIDRIKQELDGKAKEFANSYIEVLRLRAVAAEERVDELKASFDAQFQDARELGIKATEYAVLQSELKRIERFCEIVDDRIKELNVTEEVGALNISILEVARPSSSPAKPQKNKFMAVALALGLMLGSSIAVLRDMLDYRLRSTDEISVVLGIPVLGVIPTMSASKAVVLPVNNLSGLFKSIVGGGNRKIRSQITSSLDEDKILSSSRDAMAYPEKIRSEFSSVKWIQNVSKKAHKSARVAALSDESKRKTNNITLDSQIKRRDMDSLDKPDCVKRGQKAHLEPKSVVAEAYRTIRTAVFFGVPKDEAKTILITSPAPGDGKSTVASNLAIAIAQAGQKTLLLDADFRKPMQHRIFEIGRKEKGLSDVVAGEAVLEEAIRPGPVEGLDILSCGTEVPNPSEVLNSDAFTRFLKEFSERYDRVIIDSPPVSPVADSQILSAICDVTLLVLRAEVSTRRHSQHARDSLLSVGGHLIGAVVNDVRRKHGRYGYGYYSGYRYYSHYGDHGYYGSDKKERKEVKT